MVTPPAAPTRAPGVQPILGYLARFSIRISPARRARCLISTRPALDALTSARGCASTRPAAACELARSVKQPKAQERCNSGDPGENGRSADDAESEVAPAHKH